MKTKTIRASDIKQGQAFIRRSGCKIYRRIFYQGTIFPKVVRSHIWDSCIMGANKTDLILVMADNLVVVEQRKPYKRCPECRCKLIMGVSSRGVCHNVATCSLAWNHARDLATKPQKTY
jgi:ssDNA-binding Zn-finger/Zn-ribbon topoisomerase 1